MCLCVFTSFIYNKLYEGYILRTLIYLQYKRKLVVLTTSVRYTVNDIFRKPPLHLYCNKDKVFSSYQSTPSVCVYLLLLVCTVILPPRVFYDRYSSGTKRVITSRYFYWRTTLILFVRIISFVLFCFWC